MITRGPCWPPDLELQKAIISSELMVPVSSADGHRGGVDRNNTGEPPLLPHSLSLDAAVGSRDVILSLVPEGHQVFSLLF